QAAFVGRHGSEGGKERFASREGRPVLRGTAADVGQIIQSSKYSCKTFVILRAGFPASGQRFCRDAELIGPEAGKMLTLAVEHSNVRAEELVSGAGEEVAIKSANINRTVRGVVHGINENQSAAGMRQLHDLR